MLIEVTERRSLETNRKSVVYVLECEACGKRNECCRVRYERSKMHFCDNKCRGRYKHDHPETWKGAIEALNSPQSHAKAKATIQEKAARGEWHHWLGKTHTEETKRHLSEVASDGRRKGTGNGMFGRHHSEETRAKMSEKKAQAIVEGRFRPYGTQNKKGTYTSSKMCCEWFFKSSWEEAVMKHLDNDPEVKGWAYEPVRISYYYNDNKRWYVPDFLVMFHDGRHEMWEVKPREFLQTERVRHTTVAGEAYCRENGINSYRVLTGETLRSMEII
jgi:hypothetical protein